MTLPAAEMMGAGAVCLLELDAASIGPLLLSRPIFLGAVIGWLRGDAFIGAAIGVVFETLTLPDLPLGGRLVFSAPFAAGTAAWLACGPGGAPPEAALVVGLAAGFAHARIESALRRSRGQAARRLSAQIVEGRTPRHGLEILQSLSQQAMATFFLFLVVIMAVETWLPAAYLATAQWLRVGLHGAYLGAPWLGAGALASSLARRP